MVDIIGVPNINAVHHLDLDVFCNTQIPRPSRAFILGTHDIAMEDLASGLASENNLSVALKKAIEAIPLLSMIQRKTILDLTRIQTWDPDQYQFSELVRPASRFLNGSHLLEGVLFPDVIAETFAPLIRYPLICSILSSLLRSSPFPDDIARAEVDESILKEFTASQTRRPSGLIPLPEIICPAYYDIEGHGHTILNTFLPKLNGYVLSSKFQNRLFFPHYGKKVLSAETQDWASFYGLDTPVTPKDLIAYYAATGTKIKGRAQMKDAWRYNDLKPRTYYAQGGENFWNSVYLRDVLMEIVECCYPTRRFSRNEVSQVLDLLSADDILYIYDYTSFTTNLADLHDFTFYLGHILRGVMFTVLDPALGVVELDLGHLLLEYNQRENIFVEFQVHKRLSPTPLFLPQANGGMLGVQGNISLSMILHGLYLIYLVGDERYCGVAGDDAIAIALGHPPWSEISRLGDINLSKTYEWQANSWIPRESQQWKYLKRPLNPWQGGMGELPNFPIFALLFNFTSDAYHRPLGDHHQRLKSFMQQVARFLDSLPSLSLTQYEVPVLLYILRWMYRQFHVSWERGYLPGTFIYQGEELYVAVPIIGDEIFTEPWDETLWYKCPDDYFRFPVLARSHAPPHFVTVGQTFLGTPHRTIRLLEDLEVVVGELLYDWYERTEISRQLFRSFLMSELKPVTQYTFVSEPPFWYDEVSLFFISSKRGLYMPGLTADDID